MGKSNKFSLATKSHQSTRVNPYEKITLNAINVTCPDKQILLPKLESNSLQQVFIELYSLFIFIIALGTQYLNLYRSVWWLSKTKTSSPINYHLIDLDVSQFSLIFIGQSSLISLLTALLNKVTLPGPLVKSFIAQQQHQQPAPILKQQKQLTSSSSSSNNSTSTSTTSEKQQHQNNHHHHNQNSQNNHHNHNNHHQSHANHNTTTNNNNYINSNNNNSSANNNNTSTTTTLRSSSLQTTSTAAATTASISNNNTLTIIVTATASWICNYYLLKCALRIWSNFGLNGISCISYPIVSIRIQNNYTTILLFFFRLSETLKTNQSFHLFT